MTTYQDSSKIIYCKLEYGKAYGGVWDGDGGAIFCAYSKLIVKHCLLKNNSANVEPGMGGAIYCIDCIAPSQIISNNIINNNIALVQGGGIYCEHSNPEIFNNIINNNESSVGGGICCAFYGSPTLVNNVISNNIAYLGGGIACQVSSSPTITNCSIVNNTVVWENGSGEGLYCYTGGTIVIKNTIFCGNSAPSYGNQIYVGNIDYISITFSDIEGGFDEIYNNQYVNVYQNNIDTDPMFVDSTNGDWLLQSISQM